jgi:hypothetical protein
VPTRRNPDRASDVRPPGVERSPEELNGYLSGLRYRLGRVSPPEPLRASLATLLTGAEAALGSGRLAEAERALLEAEARLDDLDEETELVEFPRGLVGYVSRGPRGAAPPREEEPLANRMLLVERLWHVRRADGYSVESLLPALREAEAAYRDGDRERARRLIDRVHAALESLGERPARRSEA